MNDTHELRIFSKMGLGLIKLKVNGDAYSIIKKFEQKKLSGSPFVVYDNDDMLWAFDVGLIEYIIINNVGYQNKQEDDKE